MNTVRKSVTSTSNASATTMRAMAATGETFRATAPRALASADPDTRNCESTEKAIVVTKIMCAFLSVVMTFNF